MTPDPEPPLLTCPEALAMVQASFAGLPKPPLDQVALSESLGRVLAEGIVADRDQPPFPRSTRDGFAISFANGVASATLQVIGAIRAGEVWTGPPLRPGQAIEIMTGAPVPEGATGVLMVEHASLQGTVLRAGRTLGPGENVVPRGAEARAGQVLLQPGIRMGPAEIALAASVGRARLPVYRRPVAAILSTGDELVAIDETPGPQQIRNSNAHALAALVRQSGGDPHVLPVARDTEQSLQEAIDSAANADMLILSGGVSAGKYDLVETVLASRGAQFLFTGVAMQPGKPAVFGRRSLASGAKLEAAPAGVSISPDLAVPDASVLDHAVPDHAAMEHAGQAAPTQWIFGLPGNPVSVQVTALLFALPMLRALGGELNPQPAFASAALAQAVTTRPGLTRFLPARLTTTLQHATIEPTGWQGSGDLHSNARANCYLVVPPNVERLDKGVPVQVLLR